MVETAETSIFLPIPYMLFSFVMIATASVCVTFDQERYDEYAIRMTTMLQRRSVVDR